MMSVERELRCRTVVVTGVGAIIGQGIVKSLRRSRRAVRVIGVDRNALSLGPHLCDAFYVKPACDEASPEYLAFWQQLLEKESVDLVLPGLDVDVFFLDAQRHALGGAATVLGLNQTELIALSQDKWAFGLEVSKTNLVPIPTTLSRDWHQCVDLLGEPPFLAKPRRGSGARGIVRLFHEAEFHAWAQTAGENYMVQRIVGNDDEEFTVGAFGYGDGTAQAPIIFRRRLSPAGNTLYAEVVTDAVVERTTEALTRFFKPLGPTNYQFRKDKDTPYLLEINPRFSSSTSLRAGFGYNEAEMALDYYLENVRTKRPAVLQGQAWRYVEDFFVI